MHGGEQGTAFASKSGRVPMASDFKMTAGMIKDCVDYRTLRGKRDDFGLDLSNADSERLAGLEDFFRQQAVAGRSASPPAFVQRDHLRQEIHLKVVFQRGDGESSEGTLHNLSASGAFIETAEPLVAGQRTVVRVTDAAASVEWRIVADVAWVRGAGMGLRFVGIPLEVRLGHPLRAVSPFLHAA
ncbi:MAG: hypothetical protein EXR72_18945 [Myxococcales bacterium]|nr:hypothetical protein [Myxococcales bacterium]